MARYEFSEGSSNKFWEITLEGTRYRVRYGKIGANGQTTLKDFGDEEKAKKEYDKIIAEKVKKGYVLVDGEGASEEADEKPAAKKVAAKKKGGGGANAELEAAILENPDNPEAYLVYADWLQSQGDPRGELIAVQHGIFQKPEFRKWQELTRLEAALLEKHAAALLGGFADKERQKNLKITWQLGFVKSARIQSEYDAEVSTAQLLGELLDHPSARFLQELTVGLASSDGENEYQSVIDALVEKKRPETLRTLFLGDFEYPDETEMSWSHIGDASPLWAVFPHLRKVIFQSGTMTLGKIDLSELREFSARSGGLAGDAIKSIVNAKWPKIERLEVWFGSDNYGAEGNLEMIQPILDARGLGNLKHLGLMNAEFTDEIAAALPKSKILKQLESVDLSMGCMTKAGVDAIVAAKDAFKHLKVLSVEDNAIGDGEGDALNGVCKEVRIGDQSPDRVDEDSRYTSVGE